MTLRFPRVPLRFAIPLLISAAGSLIIITAWTFEMRAQSRTVLQVAEQQLRSSASFIAAEVEAAVRAQDVSEARAALERAISIPTLRSIHLVDPEGTIRFSSNRRLVGTAFGGQPPTDRIVAAAPFSESQRVAVSMNETTSILVGRFPVQMRQQPADLMPIRSGALYLEYDLAGILGEHRAALTQRMLRRSLMLFGIALAFWWLLSRILLSRIEAMIGGTQQVAQGRFDVDFDARGRDELAELARELQRMTGSLRDQTEHLNYLVDHDALTGLCNRVGIEAAIERALVDARTLDAHFALCLLDIDSLRVINDTQGHLAGDELLRRFAQLLEEALPDAIAVARVGGDEFAALVDTDRGRPLDELGDVLHKHIRAFRFERLGERFAIQATTGIIELSAGLRDSGEALGAADAACYQAKERQRGSVHVMNSAAVRSNLVEGSMRWVSRIHEALDEERFRLYAQPIHPIGNDPPDRLHFEVLIRMLDRDGSIVPPGHFLSAAERYNLVGRIDRWVVQSTLEWLLAHRERLDEIASCSINLSGVSLADPTLLDEISEWLDQHPAIPPSMLCFEVTETAAIRNLDLAGDFIRRMRGVGCRFALDDFGTGLSSFEYIKRLPVDFIKIDGIFIRDVVHDPVNRAIVKAIHDIAARVGLQTIAEFVENDEILRELEHIGVHFGQGFGIARPAPIDELLVHRTRTDGRSSAVPGPPST